MSEGKSSHDRESKLHSGAQSPVSGLSRAAAPGMQSASPSTKPIAPKNHGPHGSPPKTAVAGARSITDSDRQLAARIDPSRDYTFLWVTSPREQLITSQIATFQLFARRNARWRVYSLAVEVGQRVQIPGIDTGVHLAGLREGRDGDLLVSLRTADGNELVRSARADAADPIRQFLTHLTSFSGQAWDAELFGP
jgi:hypothetical protein